MSGVSPVVSGSMQCRGNEWCLRWVPPLYSDCKLDHTPMMTQPVVGVLYILALTPPPIIHVSAPDSICYYRSWYDSLPESSLTFYFYFCKFIWTQKLSQHFVLLWLALTKKKLWYRIHFLVLTHQAHWNASKHLGVRSTVLWLWISIHLPPSLCLQRMQYVCIPRGRGHQWVCNCLEFSLWRVSYKQRQAKATCSGQEYMRCWLGWALRFQCCSYNMFFYISSNQWLLHIR